MGQLISISVAAHCLHKEGAPRFLIPNKRGLASQSFQLSNKLSCLNLINCLPQPWCDCMTTKVFPKEIRMRVGGGKAEWGEKEKKNRFRRAIRRGLTVLLKIKGCSAEMLADLKTLIYCHC